MEIDMKALDVELGTAETQSEEQKQNTTQNQEKTTIDPEAKRYINFFHQTIINGTLKLNFDDEIINQLDEDLIKIIEKRFGNIFKFIEKYPEISYLITFATGYLISQSQPKKTQKNDIITIENDETKNN